MESAFSDITDMFNGGAVVIVKYLFLYIFLPEVIVIFITGGLLKIRGKLLGVIVTAVALICFYLFAMYGLEQMTTEITNLAND